MCWKKIISWTQSERILRLLSEKSGSSLPNRIQSQFSTVDPIGRLSREENDCQTEVLEEEGRTVPGEVEVVRPLHEEMDPRAYSTRVSTIRSTLEHHLEWKQCVYDHGTRLADDDFSR